MSKSEMTVNINLLNYSFKFRRLRWQEEYALKVPEGKSQIRPVLIAALEEVSGIKIKDRKEAKKVIDALPTPVADRVFIIYKAELPPSRRFETANLYCAPEPSDYVKRVVENEDVVDEVTDRAMQKMEQNFGKKELSEAAALDKEIVKKSKLRGAIKLKPEAQDD